MRSFAQIQDRGWHWLSARHGTTTRLRSWQNSVPMRAMFPSCRRPRAPLRCRGPRWDSHCQAASLATCWLRRLSIAWTGTSHESARAIEYPNMRHAWGNLRCTSAWPSRLPASTNGHRYVGAEPQAQPLAMQPSSILGSSSAACSFSLLCDVEMAGTLTACKDLESTMCSRPGEANCVRSSTNGCAWETRPHDLAIDDQPSRCPPV